MSWLHTVCHDLQDNINSTVIMCANVKTVFLFLGYSQFLAVGVVLLAWDQTVYSDFLFFYFFINGALFLSPAMVAVVDYLGPNNVVVARKLPVHQWPFPRRRNMRAHEQQKHLQAQCQFKSQWWRSKDANLKALFSANNPLPCPPLYRYFWKIQFWVIW